MTTQTMANISIQLVKVNSIYNLVNEVECLNNNSAYITVRVTKGNFC